MLSIRSCTHVTIVCIVYRGAGTILYVGGPTNQNKCYGKRGWGGSFEFEGYDDPIIILRVYTL